MFKMFGVPYATKIDDLHRSMRMPVPVYFNASRAPQCPPGDLCHGCPNDQSDDRNDDHPDDRTDERARADDRSNDRADDRIRDGGEEQRDRVHNQRLVQREFSYPRPNDREATCLGIHEKLDAIMMCVDSIDARLARIEQDIEGLEDDSDDSGDSIVSDDDSVYDSEDSDDPDDTDASEGSEYEPDENDESDENDENDESDEDSKESEDSFELGQLVSYEDGKKKRLGRIAAIDASHFPVSYTIRFEDEDERYRDTEADKIKPL